MFSSITVLELTTLDIFGKCPNLWPCASPNLALFLNVFFSCFNRPSSSQYEFYSQYFLLSLRCVFEGSFACYFLRVYRIQNFWFFRLYYGFFGFIYQSERVQVPEFHIDLTLRECLLSVLGFSYSQGRLLSFNFLKQVPMVCSCWSCK